jgi:uncharacterized phage infection (PIP) family protein YhgE
MKILVAVSSAALAVATLVPALMAQTKTPLDPPPVPQLTAEQKIPTLVAQHKLDEIQKQMKDLDSQFNAVQQQAKTRYQELSEQEKKLKAELEEATNEAYKVAHADKNQFDLDDTMTFKAKPTKAEAAPPAPPVRK